MTDVEVGRYGLRTFRVVGRDLMSVTVQGARWKRDGTCEAKCVPNMGFPTWRMPLRRFRHAAPDNNCRCGIYAALSAAALFKQYPVDAERLVCVIAAEGQTIIGDTGFRTQYARIVAYWTPVRRVLDVCLCRAPSARWYRSLDSMLDTYGFAPVGDLPYKHWDTNIPPTLDWLHTPADWWHD